MDIHIIKEPAARFKPHEVTLVVTVETEQHAIELWNFLCSSPNITAKDWETYDAFLKNKMGFINEINVSGPPHLL